NGRQLKQMSKSGTTATFLYNAEGLRIRKTVGSTVTNYTLHGSRLVHMVRGSTALHFFYDAQNRPAIVDYAGTKYAYVYSLQGDVLGLVNSSGTEVVRYVYDAWGKVLATTGTLASTVGAIQPFRYRGYIYDTETGLYYLRSRYYNPTWGRFLNADSLTKGNIFAYCENKPINNKDSDGLLTSNVIPLSPEFIDNSYFYKVVKPRILSFVENASDFSYEPKGYTRRENKNGIVIPGSIACGHAMYETTEGTSYTMPYRYTGFKGPKGKLEYINGNFIIPLIEGMEVYSEDISHVGTLMIYDLGAGEEWCVFQSASENYTLGRCLFEDDTGPNITALIDFDNSCHWSWFTYPQYINYKMYNYNKYMGLE
ncbi:MAG: RHS repeat-associated core domain-containing protein, partial [Clostridia bacterium]|nr:RHS repeat-associated core domain-containing protein [Clostridia bacterium]